jgi:hypothetical protein
VTTTPKGGGYGRRSFVSVEELEALCEKCGHQNSVHTGDSWRTRTGSWGVMFDATWQNSTGFCNEPQRTESGQIEQDETGEPKPCGCTRRAALTRWSPR